MTSTPATTRTPAEVRAFFEVHRTVRQYRTAPNGSPLPLPAEHLDVLLYAAQRAPTDATAQLYSLIRLTRPDVRQRVAALTGNAHIATASEAFVVCADVYRVGRLLEAAGHAPGHFPAIAVHFGLGDAVLAGQNLLLAAELLGYQGCWIGGVMNGLDGLLDELELPAGVLPFAALTVGLPAEDAPLRPRLPRELVIHADRYRQPDEAELLRGIQIMNPIAARGGKPGDWARLLRSYFGAGGSMEGREPLLRAALKRQRMGAAPEPDGTESSKAE